jgi:hypothetical protein
MRRIDEEKNQLLDAWSLKRESLLQVIIFISHRGPLIRNYVPNLSSGLYLKICGFTKLNHDGPVMELTYRAPQTRLNYFEEDYFCAHGGL